ncbi:MAG: YfcC family protein [Bacteroidetes bacterium]|nr:YfcC family protein [Bacteroidota bacterium]
MTKRIPDTIVILLTILVIFLMLTWVLPAGEFERAEKNGISVVVPGSYHPAEQSPQGIGAFLSAPIKGFISAAQIIGFCFLIGGAFSIVTRTGAISAGLEAILDFSKRHPKYKEFILPVIMIVFSIGGATFGMSEENLVFILITIPLAISLGYDSIVGVAIPFVGAGAGFAGAVLNPFTIGVAQGIAELPLFSGWEYRIFVWLVITAIAIVFVMVYARKIIKNPEFSPVYDLDRTRIFDNQSVERTEFTFARKLILWLLLSTLVILIFGVTKYEWYINEISGLFVGLGLAAALIYRLPLQTSIDAFKDGAKDMMTAGLVIALSKAILIVARDGKIIDTMLNSVTGIAGDFHPFVSANLMFAVQYLIHFLVPSGSGQAALTIPIMAPLSDLLGITRQTTVLIFQLGDGLNSMILPTSGVTMGILSIAKIPFNVWLKWIMPLMIFFYLAAVLLLIPPIFMFVYGPH